MSHRTLLQCSFYNLLDNYERETGVSESETAQEKKEVNDFLDACLRTKWVWMAS